MLSANLIDNLKGIGNWFSITIVLYTTPLRVTHPKIDKDSERSKDHPKLIKL